MAAVAKMKQQFGSVAEFSQAFSDIGWLADVRQLDCGNGNASFEAFISDTAILQRVAFERRAQQLFSPLGGYQSFGIPTRPVTFANICRRILQPGQQLLHMRAGAELEAISDPGFSGFTLSFKDCRVSELAQNLGLEDPDEPGRDLGVYVEPGQLASIKATLGQLFAPESMSESNSLGRSLLHDSLESEVLSLLLVATKKTKMEKAVSLRNRERALNRALEFIADHPQEALTTECLCVASASSISTLERAFRERYSVTPKRFILIQRLNQVHDKLRRQGDSGMISEVANEWGFWHMGKFAADYKKLFGYLPSQTQ